MMLLSAAVLASTYSRTAFAPLQEWVRAGLALSDNQLALIQGPAMALPVVIGAIPFGHVVDRYSRTRLLLLFVVLELGSGILTALASNFAVLVLARSLAGLAAAASSTAAFSLMADLNSPSQRGRATMVLVMSQMGGNAIVFALGGVLLTAINVGAESWRYTMLWLSVLPVPIAVIMLAMREPVRTGQVVERSSTKDAWAELWRYRTTVLPPLIGMVLAETALGAIYVWAAPALARGFSLPPERIGAIMATGLALSGIVGPVVGGFLADACQRTGGARRTTSVLTAITLITVPTGLFAFVPNSVLAGCLLVVFVVVLTAVLVIGMALFTVVIPNELRGISVALLFAAETLVGVALAPVMVSLLSGAMGGELMIGKALSIVCIAAGALASAAFGFGRRSVSDQVLE